MTEMPAHPAAQVLALLDDAAGGAALLELASALARAQQRELAVVYVESARSLVAAALPFTQVLPPSGRQWMPLQPGDVEQGFRAHAARLRQLTARVALRDTLRWSLRVMRGDLGETAARLQSESDLLLLAGTPPLLARGATTQRTPGHRPVVATLGDGDEASRRAGQVATQLARALAGVVEVAHIDRQARLLDQPERLPSQGNAGPTQDSSAPSGGGLGAARPWARALARCDVLVLPRAALDASALALLHCPVLLVG